MTKTKVTKPDTTPAVSRARTTRPGAVGARARTTAAATTEAARPPARRRRTAPRLPKPIAGTVTAALDKKAEDVVVLDLRRAGGFTDYFVICTGANPRQIVAIADAVQESLRRDFAERPALTEGADRSEWILLDYFDFVVHVFSRDCRTFYGLERLWGNAVRHEFGEPATSLP
jgi:ribosome-associated protein